MTPGSISRVSLQPGHVTDALPEDDRAAFVALEHHVWRRFYQPVHPDDPPLEVLPDGSVGVFLTISHMRKLLRQTGSRKTGEDFAAECLNEILPRLGYEDTGLVKKPRVRDDELRPAVFAPSPQTPHP